METSLDSTELLSAVRYLGPATVLSSSREPTGRRLRLALPCGELDARLAMATPYAPCPGDVVLAISGEETWVIGVLDGRGQTELDLEGDLVVRASGNVRLEAGKHLEVVAPQIRLSADRIETIARTTVERVLDCYRWVQGIFQTVARRQRTLVQEDATLRARRITAVARKDVRIDGERIKLG